MTTEKNLSIAHSWFEAFNSKNLDKLLSLYDEDAAHYSPKLKEKFPLSNGYISGKKELHNWWQDAFNRLPSLHYKVKSLTANSDRVFMEYERMVANESTTMIAEVLEFKENKIISSRVYHF